ncbi:uncharacterized protein [Physcomitrium patens]|uniref:Uncharacterized protein n=1 Tax=Physcomitrium patens TaxID=3218 RepID=A0A2K1JJ52_PHYPA|nr:uncharacterized protein LOC112291058 isoform X2 [Physcomitrium patens]PNR41570.1 hypothetical protein PHYPA_018973 [Physcomitrium patens]|eukprot:XP_024393776.1 uncharacterized protein LOC112291058 isoform X2 [Physcomitrella patens]
MDLSEKERVEKAALRKRRQQGVAAGTSRFAELEQAVQEIRLNTLLVLKTPYYRNCKAARNIRRGMRVIRELCKQMRSETVTIGKERKEKGDGSAAKRRKIGGAAEPAGNPSVVSGSASADPVVGGSPAGVNFVLLSQNNAPVITELSDSP